jgi:hypothetical protein
MLDRAGLDSSADVFSNEFFRFLTKENKWEQLDATRVSGPPPTERSQHGMVSMGSDLYVFGGSTPRQAATDSGDEGLCDDGHRGGACQIERGRWCTGALHVETHFPSLYKCSWERGPEWIQLSGPLSQLHLIKLSGPLS